MGDVRTPKGKLVGKLDEPINTLQIKDGDKTTLIEIPAEGLNIRFVSGNGSVEDVYIPPLTHRTKIA